jgi:hypothetical protein
MHRSYKACARNGYGMHACTGTAACGAVTRTALFGRRKRAPPSPR